MLVEVDSMIVEYDDLYKGLDESQKGSKESEVFIYVSDLNLVEDGIEVLVKEYGKEIIEERIGNED